MEWFVGRELIIFRSIQASNIKIEISSEKAHPFEEYRILPDITVSRIHSRKLSPRKL